MSKQLLKSRGFFKLCCRFPKTKVPRRTGREIWLDKLVQGFERLSLPISLGLTRWLSSPSAAEHIWWSWFSSNSHWPGYPGFWLCSFPLRQTFHPVANFYEQIDDLSGSIEHCWRRTRFFEQITMFRFFLSLGLWGDESSHFFLICCLFFPWNLNYNLRFAYILNNCFLLHMPLSFLNSLAAFDWSFWLFLRWSYFWNI